MVRLACETIILQTQSVGGKPKKAIEISVLHMFLLDNVKYNEREWNWNSKAIEISVLHMFLLDNVKYNEREWNCNIRNCLIQRKFHNKYNFLEVRNT